MRALLVSVLLLLPSLLVTAGRAGAQGLVFPPAQNWASCRAAIAAVERQSGGVLPAGLLASIARVESGRRDPGTGRMSPWPWTINAEGVGSFFENKAAAIAAVRDLQARGVRSIDVGCMQINLMHHPNAFASLEQAFDPLANAAYGARFLGQLHDQSGDWIAATGLYHSATPDLAADYRRLVLAAWPQEKQQQDAVPPLAQLATAWRSTMPSGAPAGFGSIAPPAGRSGFARIIPMAAGPGGVPQGRGLDAYRASPIAFASRLFRSPGG